MMKELTAKEYYLITQRVGYNSTTRIALNDRDNVTRKLSTALNFHKFLDVCGTGAKLEILQDSPPSLPPSSKNKQAPFKRIKTIILHVVPMESLRVKTVHNSRLIMNINIVHIVQCGLINRNSFAAK